MRARDIGAAIAVASLFAVSTAFAEPMSLAPDLSRSGGSYATYNEPAPHQTAEPEATDDSTPVPERFRRQIVDYRGKETAGTIIIDTPHTSLYYVVGNGRAIRYRIGVGREGFTWSGTQSISRKTEWPDWSPPEEMVKRQPYLPRFMTGGPGNPLGARALYLGNTMYRIHGTNAPSTIGGRVSSGCIRLLNADVTDLYDRAAVGTKVIVLPVQSLQHRAEPNSPRRVSSLLAGFPLPA